MNDKELFYVKMQKCFDDGIIREVYSTNNLCVLNVSDIYYVVCPYYLSRINIFGFLLLKESIEKDVLRDERIFFQCLKSLDAEEFNELAIDLDPNNYSNVVEWVKQNINKAPTEFIDREFEQKMQELMENQKPKSIIKRIKKRFKKR